MNCVTSVYQAGKKFNVRPIVQLTNIKSSKTSALKLATLQEHGKFRWPRTHVKLGKVKRVERSGSGDADVDY